MDRGNSSFARHVEDEFGRANQTTASCRARGNRIPPSFEPRVDRGDLGNKGIRTYRNRNDHFAKLT